MAWSAVPWTMSSGSGFAGRHSAPAVSSIAATSTAIPANSPALAHAMRSAMTPPRERPTT
jgi:hypothetical protein